MCDRWEKRRFANFFEDMGPCPPGLTFDRTNNDENYEPGQLPEGDEKRASPK